MAELRRQLAIMFAPIIAICERLVRVLNRALTRRRA